MIANCGRAKLFQRHHKGYRLYESVFMQGSLRYLAPGYCVRASLLIRHFDTILIVVLHNFCVAVRHRINAAETLYLYPPAVTIHEALFVGTK